MMFRIFKDFIVTFLLLVEIGSDGFIDRSFIVVRREG